MCKNVFWGSSGTLFREAPEPCREAPGLPSSVESLASDGLANPSVPLSLEEALFKVSLLLGGGASSLHAV